MNILDLDDMLLTGVIIYKDDLSVIEVCGVFTTQLAVSAAIHACAAESIQFTCYWSFASAEQRW